MMCEEDKRRVEESKNCSSCLEWHKYCQAECCKVISINISPSEFKRQMESSGECMCIIKPLLPNDRWYFKLHGIECVHGIMKFKKDRITVLDGRVIYVYKCDFLTEEMKCKGHPSNKPNICKDLDVEIVRTGRRNFFVTKNCLFRYKNLEVDVDVKKESQDSQG